MIVFFKRLFAFGSVAAAMTMLIWGVFLIRKNSPKVKETAVRFSPPTLPGSFTGNTTAGVPNRSGDDGKSRFIGGIGLIEPAGEAIAVGSQVPGIVTEVCVKPGDKVKKGDRLIVIEDRAARANVAVAKSNLVAQQAKLRELQGQVAPTRARVDSAAALLEQSKATKLNASQELTRAEKVAGNGLSLEEIELRKLNVVLADAKVHDSEAKLREAQASLDLLAGERAPSMMVQQAAVDQAESNVSKEEVDLMLRTIVAPVDATVLQVKIRVGEYAPAAVLVTPLMTLGVLDPLHIRVDIDESEIPRFHPTAQAYASVRGRPEHQVPLTYVRTEPYVVPKKTLNGGVSERVDTRVMQIIYSVSPSIIEAISGQQVDVYIAERIH